MQHSVRSGLCAYFPNPFTSGWWGWCQGNHGESVPDSRPRREPGRSPRSYATAGQDLGGFSTGFEQALASWSLGKVPKHPQSRSPDRARSGGWGLLHGLEQTQLKGTSGATELLPTAGSPGAGKSWRGWPIVEAPPLAFWSLSSRAGHSCALFSIAVVMETSEAPGWS